MAAAPARVLRIDVNADVAIRRLRRGERRLAYAVANAINTTMVRAQAAVRTQVERTYEVRQRQFILRQAAIIKPFASARQGRPFAEISVGQRPRLLLSLFERGGERTPVKGRRVAVPITGQPARPTFGQAVPRELRFQQLRLSKSRPSGTTTASGRPRRQRAGGGVRYGRQRTYLVPDVGVFQARDRGESELLYAFIEPPRLKPSLRFVDVVTRTIRRVFPAAMAREKREAFRRATGRDG